MIKKILMPLLAEEVAPRFDLATEVRIITTSTNNVVEEERTIVLAQASAEKLCQLILLENIKTVICGAIEDEYFQFLTWKKVSVFDSVAGVSSAVFEQYLAGALESGMMLFNRQIEGENA